MSMLGADLPNAGIQYFKGHKNDNWMKLLESLVSD